MNKVSSANPSQQTIITTPSMREAQTIVNSPSPPKGKTHDFKNGALKRLMRLKPGATSELRQQEKLEKVLAQKFKPCGDRVTINFADGSTAQAHGTAFPDVFKLSVPVDGSSDGINRGQVDQAKEQKSPAMEYRQLPAIKTGQKRKHSLCNDGAMQPSPCAPTQTHLTPPGGSIRKKRRRRHRSGIFAMAARVINKFRSTPPTKGFILLDVGKETFALPDEFKSEIHRKLNNFKPLELESIIIDVSLLPRVGQKSPTVDPEGLFSARAAALIVATVARHFKDATDAGPSIVFECENDADQALFAGLIEQAEELASEQTYQALLRPEIKHPSQVTPLVNFSDNKKSATYVPQAIGVTPENGIEILPKAPFIPSLNNVAFTPLQRAGTAVNRQAPIQEPDSDDIRAAGTVIVEENGDGRVWVVTPTNYFMKLTNTFPKGQREPGLSAQETAIKESREESGLEVELVQFLCDSGRDNKTRYYLARRIGGTPEDVEWESQAVKLVPKDQLLALFPDAHHGRDRSVATHLLNNLS